MNEGISNGDYQFVYFTPETLLLSKRWRAVLAGDVFSSRLQYFIVDEAHTVVQWQVHGMIYTVVELVSQIFVLCRGETFRSILLRIEEMCSLSSLNMHTSWHFTATERLRKDASRLMGLRNEVVVQLAQAEYIE